ncbi:mitochondrial transcription factor A [Arctopsyche grandis]|uniref:mitochondrial transcription factor A n=1 Tax=Arctopsyche grandis TaxID=121162 RepID=UPI00406DA352
MAAWLTLCRRYGPSNSASPFRLTPLLWNCSAGYTKVSAEDKLGIDKPKRPLTAFIKFFTQIRPTLVAKNPGTSATSILKMASQHWHQLGDDVKEKLSKEFLKEMEEFKKIKATYEASLSEEQKQEIKKVRKQMDDAKEKKKLKSDYKEFGRPKKPMSSYLLFCNKHRDSYKDLNFTDFQIDMKNKWYALAEEERSIWNNQAQKLKDEYRKKLTLWEEKMIRMGNIDLVRNTASRKNAKAPA